MTFAGISLVKVLPIVAFGTRSVSVGPFHPRQFVGLCSYFTVKGRELGSGRAHTKGGAQDEAAQMAFEALSSNPLPGITMLTLRRRKSFP